MGVESKKLSFHPRQRVKGFVYWPHMEVIKANGEHVAFDIQKVRRSIERTGASEGIVQAVLARVEKKLYDGIPTKELYALVREELSRDSVCFSCRYSLRDGILMLGPAGFKFEKYVASLLNAYGYKAYVPEADLQGACVPHEVDVVAEKDSRRMFIEAKFRNRYQDYVNLKDILATWARFLDLVDGASAGKGEYMDEAWLVTNARFSDAARTYGACKGMKLIGWDYPTDRTFASMIDHAGLYPVTVIAGVKKEEIEAMAEKGLMLCRELLTYEPDDLSERLGLRLARAEQIIDSARQVVEGDK